MSQASSGIRVSPAVARVVAKDVSQKVRLQAARGELELTGRDLLLALVFLWHGNDPTVKAAAGKTLRCLPEDDIVAALGDDSAPHPRLLSLLARSRWRDVRILDSVLAHTDLTTTLLEAICTQASQDVLLLLEQREFFLKFPDLVTTALANPAIDEALRTRLNPPAALVNEAPKAWKKEDSEEQEDVELDEDKKQSKYQQALDMKIAEKIKMALTGDKEWRAIFLKDSNKLVCSAAMKNPRITEGEVLAIAKLKTSNEELIRLITMNREWVKKSEIKKALVAHPRTPLPKALRYMDALSLKDLKILAKSKGVSQALVNTARKKVSDIARKS